MRIVVQIPPELTTPKERASAARAVLLAVVHINMLVLQRWKQQGRRFDLYKAGIVFRREPWRKTGIEEFENIPQMVARGWADCDGLASALAAQYRVAGIKAGIKVYWRKRRDPKTGKVSVAYHAETRLPGGKVEDPSRFLGG